MSAPVTFAELVHDFGLASWPLEKWKRIGHAGISRLADEVPAKRAWWRRTIRQFLHNGINENTLTRIQNVIKAAPEWLLTGDHSATYFNPRIVPRDITNVIFGYLRRTLRMSTTGGFHSVTTQFCGFEHSFNDAPAYFSSDPKYKSYIWYWIGAQCRTGDLPDAIFICEGHAKITWSRQKFWSNHGSNIKQFIRFRAASDIPDRPMVNTTCCIEGDGSMVELAVINYIADAERKNQCSIDNT